MTTTATTPIPSSWRERYPVHPCADVFPMLSDVELDALAEDIKAHGLRELVVLKPIDGVDYVLDGRNRLEALARLGVIFQQHIATHGRFRDGTTKCFARYESVVDPAVFVISANIRRRHLTKEQQAELIVKTIEAGQATNDRAKVARSFSPTPSKRGGSTKDPILDQAVTEAKKHGISKRTVQTARAKVHGTATPKKPPVTRVTKRDVEEARAETQQAREEAARFNTAAWERIAEMVDVRFRMLLGNTPEATALRQLARRVIDTGYKALAPGLHPDKGGSTTDMARLNVVRDYLKSCCQPKAAK